MTIATVTVLYVNPPKEGKRYGSIKTKELDYIGVLPDKLSQFEKGQQYEIEYKQSDKGFKDFIRIVSKPGGGSSNGGGSKSAGDSRSIFITGIVGRAMGSGKFDPADIKTLTLEANEAWAALLAVNTPPKSEEPPY